MEKELSKPFAAGKGFDALKKHIMLGHMRNLVMCGTVLLLSACSALQPAPDQGEVSGEARDEGVTTDILVRPRARPASLAPIAVQEPVENDVPQAPDAAGNGSLGTTIASLGNPAEAGLWLKTPLVGQERAGRVVFPQTGKTVSVTLIPLEGPKTGGSQLSLSAMQAIGAPLTELPTIEVFL